MGHLQIEFGTLNVMTLRGFQPMTFNKFFITALFNVGKEVKTACNK